MENIFGKGILSKRLKADEDRAKARTKKDPQEAINPGDGRVKLVKRLNRPARHRLDGKFDASHEKHPGKWFSSVFAKNKKYCESVQKESFWQLDPSTQKFRAFLDYHKKYYVDQNNVASGGEDLDSVFSRDGCKYPGRTYSYVEREDPQYAAFCFVNGFMNSYGNHFCDFLEALGYRMKK